MEVLEYINLLNKDIEKCCTEAEERHNLSLFLKGNAMWKAVKEKNALFISDLDKAIENLEKGRKKK